jgi:hypothetical protein
MPRQVHFLLQYFAPHLLNPKDEEIFYPGEDDKDRISPAVATFLSELMLFALLHLRCTYRSLQCARQFSVASDISPTRNKRSRFEAQTSRVAFAISRLLMLQTGDRHYV